MTPEFLKLSMIGDFEGFEREDSLTRAKVGWPALTAAGTIYLPIYPVPPMIRILLFPAISRFVLSAKFTSRSCFRPSADSGRPNSQAVACIYYYIIYNITNFSDGKGIGIFIFPFLFRMFESEW